MKKFLKLITSIVLYSALIIVLFLFISSRFPLIFGLRSFDVLTGSMEPKIHVGSLVITKPASTFKIGEIITFNRGSITVTHRIAGLKDGKFITKGDANKIADSELVKQSDIIGQDAIIIPYFGKFITFLKTAPGFTIFIVLPTLIFIFFQIIEFKREWEKEVEKKVLKKIREAQQP